MFPSPTESQPKLPPFRLPSLTPKTIFANVIALLWILCVTRFVRWLNRQRRHPTKSAGKAALTVTRRLYLQPFSDVDDEILDALRHDAADSTAALSAGIDACCSDLPPARRALLACALLAERERGDEPSPPQHIILRCARAGLCNRLRTVLSYALVCAESGGSLDVIWKHSDECPGLFLDHFQPIPGVRFLDDGPPFDAEVIEANDYHPSVKGRPAREALCWAALVPLPQVRDEVEANVAACGDAFAACHVRRTDHFAIAMGRHVGDDDFARFCDARAPTSVFLATDCAETRRGMRERCGARCIVGPHDYATGLRQTSLRASAVDLLTCARARVFKGSRFSSFSDAIARLRQVGGTAHPSDEHEHRDPPSDTPYWREAILKLALE